MNATQLSEAIRIYRASQRRKRKGIKRYRGDAREICQRIVKECWNGRFFQVSNGNFPQFYTRDFGWCADALLKLKYRDEVKSTLEYAMEKFVAAGKVTVAITPDGRPFDVPEYAVDSLPYFLRSVRVAGMKGLVRAHRDFLERQVEKFAELVVADNGMVRTDRSFSSMKDHAKRQSSCYDNCMVALLKEELKRLRLSNPLKHNYQKLLKEELWTGSHFLDDVSGKNYVAGDANLFPFWTGVFTDKKMMKSAFAVVQEQELDRPFPLRYALKGTRVNMRFLSNFVRDYERDTVWTHMGPLFMQLVKNMDKNRYHEYRVAYNRIIEHYGSFLEVYFPSGEPYKNFWYHSDEGMLWAANILA